MSTQTPLMNWIKAPERTKTELVKSLQEHLADGYLLDAIQNHLDAKYPYWDEKPSTVIRRRALNKAEVMAQIDSALEDQFESIPLR